jgi:uncharacterized protein YndB with AHSA1/START domain
MNSFGIIVDAGTVEFKRVMPGPIERVWAFITERNNLARWLGDGVLGPAGTRYELKIEIEGNPIEFATTVFPQLLPEYERRFSEVGRTK